MQVLLLTLRSLHRHPVHTKHSKINTTETIGSSTGVGDKPVLTGQIKVFFIGNQSPRHGYWDMDSAV